MKKGQKALVVLVVLVGAVLIYWTTSKVWYFTQLIAKGVGGQTLLQVALIISGLYSVLFFLSLYAVLRAGPLGSLRQLMAWLVIVAILLFGPAVLDAINGWNATKALVLLIVAIAMPWVFRFVAQRRKRNNHPPS